MAHGIVRDRAHPAIEMKNTPSVLARRGFRLPLPSPVSFVRPPLALSLRVTLFSNSNSGSVIWIIASWISDIIYATAMSLRLLSLAFVASALANPFDKAARDSCNPCNPSGATGSTPPSVGPDLKSLYTDVLASVKDIHFNKRWTDAVTPRDDSFCCAATLSCVNVVNLNIPMCYDKFTTNFAFADRSYGSLTTGNYTQGDATANLLTGEYEKDGSEGNIYADDPSAKPNTATMSIPPQWTGPGVGSAIPPTAIVGNPTASAQTTGQVSSQTTAQTASPTGSSVSEASASSSSTSAANPEAASAEPSKGVAAPGSSSAGTPLVASFFTALMYVLYGF